MQNPQPFENTGHPRRWAILGVLVISLLVVVLDNTILNVALRTLSDPVHGLGASQGELEWAINSYTLVFAGLLFTFGVLGDRLGRKRFLLFGLAMFGLSSLLSAYAQNPGQLVGARALMGLGGAAIMPATLSIISNVFDPRERARAIGVWSGSVGLAVAIGPVLGGLLLEHFWWGSVFLINVPVVLVGLVAAAILVPESRDPRPNKIDVVGVLLSVIGLVALSYGIIDGGEHGFGRPLVWVAIIGGLAVLGAFVVYERRVEFPSLDVRLFKMPRFAAPVAVVGLTFFATMGVMFFSSFYLQLVRGYEPLHTGLLYLPFAAAQLIFAPRSAAMVKRYGSKAVSAVGLTLTALALFVFVFIGAETPIWVLLVSFFVQGVGMANIVAPATESVMSSLPREKAGVGSAVSNTIRQVGGALGVAVIGSVLAGVYRDQIASATGALPAPARDAVNESISGAYAAAAQLGPAGQSVIGAANDAYVSAMHWASGISTVIVVLGILVVLRWMPGRAATQSHVQPEPAATPELATTS
ncbi:EmrB/QacA subfamily drug resistance transporter [Micromonospora pisi]|uniref:EmrB/QacA subfamily drug resistance transporter n=1 Tax=Micromonospora pisi TaxID=589240 RepID=A0A495JTA1_9ACTN|nr:MFS transporter [Micromonospora pisi]RKR91612.1 EmrB/QacA subfamily drug resistance transporter [Micromonospora pisi]